MRSVAHVLVRVHQHAADADTLYAVERSIVALEVRGDGCRVAAFDDAYPLECERFLGGLYLELAPSSCPPPGNAQRGILPPVGKEAVADAGTALANELVAVALVLVLVLRTFHPHPAHFRTFPAADVKFRIGAIVVVQIQQGAKDRVRGNRHGSSFLQERVQVLDERMPSVFFLI